MERPLVTAVTHSTEDARLTLTGVPDQPGVAGRIFGALAEADINVDMIIQNEPVSPAAPGGAVVHAAEERPRDRPGARSSRSPASSASTSVIADEAMGTVSLVGAGMRSHPGRRGKGFPDARRTARSTSR